MPAPQAIIAEGECYHSMLDAAKKLELSIWELTQRVNSLEYSNYKKIEYKYLESKICRQCGKRKSIDDFVLQANGQRGGQCKKCRRKVHQKWCKKNAYKIKGYRFKTEYGITLNDFEEMLEGQNYKCAICKITLDLGAKTHVDHDHITGKVRGLLCPNCNYGLGFFKDNPISLLEAIKYLNNY